MEKSFYSGLKSGGSFSISGREKVGVNGMKDGAVNFEVKGID